MLCWALHCASLAFAQVITQPEAPDTLDWQSWTSVSLDWKPVKGLRLELQEQWRFKENMGTFDRQFHQLTANWTPQGHDLLEAQSIGFAGRLMTRQDNQGDNQGLERHFRWHAQYALQWDPGRWSFSSRVRYQRRKAVWLKDGDDPSEAPVKSTWRVKATVKHNLRKWKLDPELSVERFSPVLPDGWPADQAWRVRLGTEFKPGKRQRIKLGIQREWKDRYLPVGVGAGLDDFRLYGNQEWALVVAYRYRMKTGS